MRRSCTRRLENLAVILTGLTIALNLQAADTVFDNLAETIEREAENKALPMLSIVLVDEDGIAWSFGLGPDSANPELVADGNTTYRIGSVSKLFTDIVVMQMVEQGVLGLDEPVSHHVPDFRPHNPFEIPITLRSLMSHSSGLVREPPVC